MQNTTAPAAVLEPEMEASYFGVSVAYADDEGDMVALGHPEARRVFAAFNRHARITHGQLNLGDSWEATVEVWAARMTQTWALFRRPCIERDDDFDNPWTFDIAHADTPGAIAVTVIDLCSSFSAEG